MHDSLGLIIFLRGNLHGDLSISILQKIQLLMLSVDHLKKVGRLESYRRKTLHWFVLSYIYHIRVINKTSRTVSIVSIPQVKSFSFPNLTPNDRSIPHTSKATFSPLSFTFHISLLLLSLRLDQRKRLRKVKPRNKSLHCQGYWCFYLPTSPKVLYPLTNHQ